MSKRKNVIRENDVVKIINPEFVVRVGYPLSKKMIQDQLTPEELAVVKDMFTKFGISIDVPLDVRPTEGQRAYNKVLDALSGVLLYKKGWGGRERSIHTKLIPEMMGTRHTVYQKRCVKTGTYHAGWGGCDYWGEYDYEPAYLEGEKTHVLLKLNEFSKEIEINGDYLEIESKNVVKVVRDDYGNWTDTEHPSGLSGEHSVVLDAIHQVCLHGR